MQTVLNNQEKEYYPVFVRLAVVLLAVVFIYINTYWSMVEIWWRSGTFAHGFVVFPISLYLIWRRRNDLSKTEIKADMKAMPLLIGLVCAWIIASIANVLVAQQIAVVLMIPVIIYTLLGLKTVKTLFFPLAYLLFLVPIGEFLVPLLQDITAEFTVTTLRFTGIPVLLEGRFLYLPSGSFEVAEACSGVRYLIASLALGTLYAYLTYHSYFRRAVFILLSILIPIVANALRAYGIVMLAHLSDYKLAVGVDHIIYGWLFFGLVILLMFWVGRLFKDDDAESDTSEVLISPVTVDKTNQKSFFGLVLATCLVLAIGPVSAAWINEPVYTKEPVFADLLQVDDWIPEEIIDISNKPKFVGVSTEKYIAYHKNNSSVRLYIAYYRAQTQGHELINSKNKLYGQPWKRVSNREFELYNGDKHTWTIKEIVVKSENQNRILWYWYEVGGMSTVNPMLAKVYEVRSRFLRMKIGDAIVMISRDYDQDVDQARSALKEFLTEKLPKIRLVLKLNKK
jgi:exosortase A